jgi:hypothetical protein
MGNIPLLQVEALYPSELRRRKKTGKTAAFAGETSRNLLD